MAGLSSLPSSTTKDDLARLFASNVVDSWRWRRRQRTLSSRWLRWWHGLPAEASEAEVRRTQQRSRRSTHAGGRSRRTAGAAANPDGPQVYTYR